MSEAATALTVGLSVWDLFSEQGGGQAVYRQVVLACPEVRFVYPVEFERRASERPSNCIAVPWSRGMVASWLVYLGEQQVDVVDIPDWLPINPSALRSVGVERPPIVVGLHGRLSDTLKYEQGVDYRDLAEMLSRESALLRVAEAAYGISEPYLRYLSEEVDTSLFLIEESLTRRAMDRASPSEPDSGERLRDEVKRRIVVPIGRSERRKGLDRFARMLPWIDPKKVDQIDVLIDSTELLSASLTNRQINPNRIPVSIRASRHWRKYLEDASPTTIAIFPSRHETFGLTVGEACSRGLVVLASREILGTTQVSRIFPKSSLLVSDFEDPRGTGLQLSAVLGGQEGAARPLDAMIEVDPEGPASGFERAPSACWVFRSVTATKGLDASAPTPAEWPTGVAWSLRALRVRTELRVRRQLRLIRGLPVHLSRQWHERARRPRLRDLVYSAARKQPQWLRALANGFWVRRNLRKIWWLDPVSTRDALAPLLAVPSPGRLPVFAALMTAARGEGDTEKELTYALRISRLSPENQDQRSLEGRILDLFELRKDVSGRIAYVSKGAGDSNEPSCVKEFLEAQRLDLMTFSPIDEVAREWITDGEATPSVSVIVSLYNAHNELPTFLQMMSLQTVVRDGTAEIVFIDSDSPGNEEEQIQSWIRETGATVRYLRSAQRESIQEAWNRGIEQARGEYLAFLGVDEWLFPDALESLRAHLQDEPHLTWAMGDSVVYEVDEAGQYQRYVMAYDRTGAHKWSPVLETCYLSWVGGLYRKSQHQHGHYDGSFRGAGDTEFKNRMMRHIEWAHLPGVFGGFSNFPRGTTTGSAAIEIEDDRAWYMFRDHDGLEWLTAKATDCELIELFVMCMGYRKSYSDTPSTDVELAASLSGIIRKRLGGEQWTDLHRRVKTLRESYAHLDLRSHSIWRDSYAALGLWRSWSGIRRDLERLGYALEPCRPSIWSDNRFEQHSWAW